MIHEHLKGVPTPKLATIFPMIGATQIWARYVIPNTGPNWFGVAPFLVASIGKKGAWRCLLLFQCSIFGFPKISNYSFEKLIQIE